MKETNMGHFRSEIEEMMARHKHCLPAVIDGKPVECLGTRCDECMLYEVAEHCSTNFIKWLMSEYKPETVLTAREKGFVEFVQDGWLAADIDGFLYWHELKPRKNMAWRDWCSDGECTDLYPISHGTFRFITWEDEEPWSVEELRKLKVKE